MKEFDELHFFLSQYGAFSKEDLGLLLPHIKPRSFKKKEFLFSKGSVCDTLLIISEGFFRVYVEYQDVEQTIHLAGPNDFVSAFSSFISRLPRDEQVQAVTDAHGFILNYNDLQVLYKKHPVYERMGRLILESLFVRKEDRVISLIKHSAESRYRELMTNQPEIIKNVPLIYIASYLGIKPETLSRIRARFC